MPLTFRKRVRLFKVGPFRADLNVSKRGVSLSTRLGKLITTTQRRGRTPRTSVNLPGPVGYVTGGKSTRKPKRRPTPPPPARGTPDEVEVEYGPVVEEPDRFNPYG